MLAKEKKRKGGKEIATKFWKLEIKEEKSDFVNLKKLNLKPVVGRVKTQLISRSYPKAQEFTAAKNFWKPQWRWG